MKNSTKRTGQVRSERPTKGGKPAPKIKRNETGERVERVNGAPVYTAPAAPAATAAPARSATPATADAAGTTKVTAPMPGTILSVKVTVGQSVKKGDVICVLEAMKMENDIPAPCDGVVASINAQKGASVNANDILASLN